MRSDVQQAERGDHCVSRDVFVCMYHVCSIYLHLLCFQSASTLLPLRLRSLRRLLVLPMQSLQDAYRMYLTLPTLPTLPATRFACLVLLLPFARLF
jgi:hypothetical protein